MKEYTITKKSYQKHGEEAAGSIVARFAEYGEAYAEARRILEQPRSRRVLFLQQVKDGEMMKEYAIRKSPITKGNGDIKSEAQAVASLEMAERKKRRRADAYAKAKAEGRPFLDVYREMTQATRKEDARKRAEIIKAEKKRLREAKGETLQDVTRKQGKAKGQTIETDAEAMAELMAELDNIREGKF